MNPLHSILCGALLIPAASCRTQVRRGPAEGPPVEAAIASPFRAFEVVEGGEVVGILVEFVEVGGARRFFSVRNGLQQELGLVDQHGRSWRFRAHREDEAEWLGTGTVLDGAIRILRLGPGCELYEVGLEQLAAPPPPAAGAPRSSHG